MRPWEDLSRPWHAAMRALADDYVRACEAEGVVVDPWTRDALVAAADQRTWPARPEAMPQAPEAEATARKRVVRRALAAARSREVDLPPNVLAVMTSWAERRVR